MVALGVLTATDVGYPQSEECLTEILSSFNLRDIVITLARINLLLQRSDNSSQCEQILKENFCSGDLYNRLNQCPLTDCCIFTRAATLLLLRKCVTVSNPIFTDDPEMWFHIKSNLARCYLLANGLLRTYPSESERDLTDEQRKQFNGRNASILRIRDASPSVVS